MFVYIYVYMCVYIYMCAPVHIHAHSRGSKTTGGLSIWGLFNQRFWNHLGTFKLPSKGVKMHACSWSLGRGAK